jgi:hypothetical protein
MFAIYLISKYSQSICLVAEYSQLVYMVGEYSQFVCLVSIDLSKKEGSARFGPAMGCIGSG